MKVKLPSRAAPGSGRYAAGSRGTRWRAGRRRQSRGYPKPVEVGGQSSCGQRRCVGRDRHHVERPLSLMPRQQAYSHTGMSSPARAPTMSERRRRDRRLPDLFCGQQASVRPCGSVRSMVTIIGPGFGPSASDEAIDRERDRQPNGRRSRLVLRSIGTSAARLLRVTSR